MSKKKWFEVNKKQKIEVNDQVNNKKVNDEVNETIQFLDLFFLTQSLVES